MRKIVSLWCGLCGFYFIYLIFRFELSFFSFFLFDKSTCVSTLAYMNTKNRVVVCRSYAWHHSIVDLFKLLCDYVYWYDFSIPYHIHIWLRSIEIINITFSIHIWYLSMVFIHQKTAAKKNYLKRMNRIANKENLSTGQDIFSQKKKKKVKKQKHFNYE